MDESWVTQWAIYYLADDRPGPFTVREWRLRMDLPQPVPGVVADFSHLEAARAAVPAGLVRMPPSADDVPALVEVWL